MLKTEFESRVRMEVSSTEFDAINEVYMNCDLDKDAFCKNWKKINAKRIKAYKEAEKERNEAAVVREEMHRIEERLSRFTFGDIKPYGVFFLTEKERMTIEKAGIKLTLSGSGQWREMIDIALDIYDFNHKTA